MNDTQAQATITRRRWGQPTLDDAAHYLSKMCAAGWRPVSASAAGHKFVFVRSEPGEYVCTSVTTVRRTGLFMGAVDYRKYHEMVALLDAQGATAMPWPGTRLGGILAISRADKDLEINTDTASKIADLKARRMLYSAHLSMILIILLPYMVLVFNHRYDNSALSLAFGVAATIGWLFVAGKYGWAVTRYSREIGRLERDLAAFE